MDSFDANSAQAALPLAIVATRVEDAAQRLSCLRAHCGRHGVLMEYAVSEVLRTLCASYDGSDWHFHILSNGGFYLAPALDTPLVLVSPHLDALTVSADTAGMIACAYALPALGFEPARQRFGAAYARLSEYIAQHADRVQIGAALG